MDYVLPDKGIASIKLNNKYNDFKALIYVLRDQAIKDYFVYFIKRYNNSTFIAICYIKHNNPKRFTCL
jgi:hypothetical protein